MHWFLEFSANNPLANVSEYKARAILEYFEHGQRVIIFLTFSFLEEASVREVEKNLDLYARTVGVTRVSRASMFKHINTLEALELICQTRVSEEIERGHPRKFYRATPLGKAAHAHHQKLMMGIHKEFERLFPPTGAPSD